MLLYFFYFSIFCIHIPSNRKDIDVFLFWKKGFSRSFLESCIKSFSKATKLKEIDTCEGKCIKGKQGTEKIA